MAQFDYQGRTLSGETVKGSVEAVDKDAAAEQIFAKGIVPLKLKQAGSNGNIDLSQWFPRQLSLEVLVMFCRQLFSLTKAGVPLLRAIHGLAQNTENKQLKVALEEVTADLTNGRALAASMQRHELVFDSLFVSLINVGENTGRLDTALLQLAQYYEQEVETRKRIKTAMRYPVFVLSFIAIAVFVLNVKVIPQFTSMFDKFGVDLPLPTQILIATSGFFVNYWMWIVAGSVGGIFALKVWIATEEGHVRWDSWRLRMPIVGGVINRALLSRFSRTFAMMLSAGVPLNQALSLAAESLDNRHLELKVLEMKTAIESGSTVSSTAQNSGIFTPLVLQMLQVGEETGRIDELLLEVSDFYDREVDYDLKTMTARIEPLLLSLVAGMVLILALGIFLPMWGMLDVMKG